MQAHTARMDSAQMVQYKLTDVAQIIGAKASSPETIGLACNGVSIDSRTVKSGELFFAIVGEKLNGHDYVTQALSNGAIAAIISESRPEFANLPVITVRDTHAALIALAINYRKSVRSHNIGVTGSYGKTTVKEMLNCLLKSASVHVYASQGNLNNLYGLPLAILRMPQDTEYAVFELGISTPGEMAQLAPILEPEVGVITAVGATHLEFLGSIEGVRNEKAELLKHLSGVDCAVVPAEDSALVSLASDLAQRVSTFSASADSNADVHPDSVTYTSNAGAEFRYNGETVTLQLFGDHQVSNAMCAIAACRALAVHVDPTALNELSAGAFGVVRADLRGEIREIRGVQFVMDCYNASPGSMRSGIKTFLRQSQSATGKSILLLGDMLELGDTAQNEHSNIGDLIVSLINEFNISQNRVVVITVGNLAKHIGDQIKSLNSTVQVIECRSTDDAGKLLSELVNESDRVYVKASRGIALEMAVDRFVTLRRDGK